MYASYKRWSIGKLVKRTGEDEKNKNRFSCTSWNQFDASIARGYDALSVSQYSTLSRTKTDTMKSQNTATRYILFSLNFNFPISNWLCRLKSSPSFLIEKSLRTASDWIYGKIYINKIRLICRRGPHGKQNDGQRDKSRNRLQNEDGELN